MITYLLGRLVLQPSVVCIGLEVHLHCRFASRPIFYLLCKQTKESCKPQINHRRETSIGLETHLLLATHRLVLPLATHLVSNKPR